MTYYKGQLFNASAYFNQSVLLGDFEHSGFSKVADKFKDHVDKEDVDKYYETEDINYIINSITQDYLDDSFKSPSSYLIINIIYEIIKDKTNQLFGKEIITGRIFPLITKEEYCLQSRKIVYYMEHSCSENYHTPKAYLYQDGKIYSSDLKYGGCKNDEILFLESATLNGHRLLYPHSTTVYDLIKKGFFNRDVLLKVGTSINSLGIANQNEIEKYQRNYSGFKKRKIVKILERAYNENVFARDVILKEEKQEEKKFEDQNKMTIIMENIEYMLSKIAKIDINLKNTFQKEYEEILKSENQTMTLKPFDIKTFIILENKIELSLRLLKRKANNIMDYLNDLKKEYLENILNNGGNKTDITIDEIDKINELFLKSKDSYSIISQREILKKFALIYLLEALENKDVLSSDELENSYFKTHLKTILIYVEVLMGIGLIKSNILIDLDNEINVNYVLSIINNIEINQDKRKRMVISDVFGKYL